MITDDRELTFDIILDVHEIEALTYSSDNIKRAQLILIDAIRTACFKKAVILNLSDLDLSNEDLEHLEPCIRILLAYGTYITSIDLSGNSRLSDISGIFFQDLVVDSFSSLTQLILDRCTSLTTLAGIEKLTQLTTLNLSNCWGLTTLAGIVSTIS